MEQNNSISFILDGQPNTIAFDSKFGLSPTTTVLNYLRSLRNHKGVKEGCAEGDCGACTLVLGELTSAGQHRKIAYKAIDSCLVFLPMLHGKQLITVENLKKDNCLAIEEDALHPVQQSMVNHNGAQCGFCTPGIVMSLFSLYKNTDNPDKYTIEESLAGNLCRCTGYRAIIDAAKEACTHDTLDQFSAEAPHIIEQLHKIGENRSPCVLESDNQKYFKPFILEDALDFRNHYPEALVVSGGTDLALRVTKKHELLTQILDISDIDSIKAITETEKDIHIGAGVSLQKVLEYADGKLPDLYKMLSVFGSLQIRNLATMGGNVANASPIGDTPPILLAHEARIVLASVGQVREILLSDFIVGYRKTALQENELIVEIIIPKPQNRKIFWSHKVSKRKDLDISTVSAGFMLQMNDNYVVEYVKLYFGGMADRVKHVPKAEAFLIGKKWNRENVEAAMPMIAESFTPISDARANKEFRSTVASNLLMKFFIETQETHAA